ncbi:Ig-like domain-containing protein, partial [candidate division KSB1 bacterium]|nr:Ig-like domain-containing protein [candidate division KSB1 bacterium]
MARLKVSTLEILILLFIFVFSGASAILKAESLKLLWDQNRETDLKGYKIYYGTATGKYSSHIDVGKMTTYTLNNLNANTTYYFVLTAYDSAGNESAYSKEVSGTTRAVDTTPPQIQLCRINSATQIDVTFSEAVTKESAETIANYSINNGIQVLKAQLDGSQFQLVHLTTSAHQTEGDYTLTISNIKDRYNPPNTIMANSTVVYNFILPDTTRPTITKLEVLQATQLQITFSEKVNRNIAQNIKNYSISNGVTISAALLESDEKRVTLTTSEHPNNREYALTVNNIADLAPKANVIKPNTSLNYVVGKLDKEPPQITSVRLVDLTHVEINFSEKVTKVTAQDAENYQINDGIQIISASLSVDEQRVTLTTTQHAYNHRYTIVMNGIQDLAYPPNSIPINSSKTYILEQADIIAPTISRVELLTPSLVEIVFSESITKASAEIIQNFSISDGIVVHLAKLQADNKTVYLNTSEHTPGHIYTITISNIKDRSSNGNVIAANSQMTYFKEAIDVTPPVLEKVIPLNLTEIKVEFSELITQESAENKNNYSIDQGVVVQSVQLQPELKSVILKTSAHVGNRNYTLTVNNITDRAKSPNQIAANSQLSYFMAAPDKEAPKISTVNKKSLTEIELVFTEALEKTSAELTTNYRIDNGINIENAKIDESEMRVTLTTSTHERGKTYSITANNVSDKANPPNIIAVNSVMNYIFEMIDTEPPRIETVQILDAKKVEITFSEQVTRESAENIANYQINNGIEIVSAALRDNLKVVWLTTSTHDAEVTYQITINNILDRATPGNIIAINSQQTYILPSTDTTAPQITSVEILSATKVDVLFSEPVEKLSAEKVTNYSIDKGIQIIKAELDPDMRRVHLTTSEHSRGTNYSITINYVLDRATPPNIIVVNSSASYYFKIVDMISPEISIFRINSETEIEITFTEPLDKISAETLTNYSIDKGIQVQKATLQANNLVVVLKTSPHQRGELYTIILNKIYDLAVVPNEIKQNTSYSYSLPTVDTIKPALVAVNLESETVVKVVFSEPIDKSTAENTNNYYINNGIFISSAVLLNDQRTVKIQTSAHKRGRDYLIQVTRIKDLAQPSNEILPNSSYSYYYELIDQEAPKVLGIKVYSDMHLEVVFNE